MNELLRQHATTVVSRLKAGKITPFDCLDALEADDVGAAGIGARDLDGVLDGFRAGRDEQALLVAGDRRDLIELFG